MSGVRRPRKARKPRAPRQTPGIYRGTVAEGDDLAAAAEVIADEARRLASAWSSSIPGAIEVEVSGSTATVSCAVGPAYPNETGAAHPLFAHGPRSKWTWRDRNGKPFLNNRPFLGPAADAKASDAMDRYAKKLDRLLEKAGFK